MIMNIICYYLVLYIFGLEVILTCAQLDEPSKENTNKLRAEDGTVKIQVYYESLCPYCRDFDTKQLRPTVQKLGPHLDIHLNPYGKANTTVKGGQYEFTCQHGPEECYGNKLHACAIDFLQNATKSVFFNACMMDLTQQDMGSDDAAADACGKSMQIDSETIKECAKGEKGSKLLKNYGDESKTVNFKYVPYVLINGVENNRDNFMRDVCAAFQHPPPECDNSNQASTVSESQNKSHEIDENINSTKINEINTEEKKEKVKLQVFYECLCPFSILFGKRELQPTVEKLAQYLDVDLYPYGNADTIVNEGHYEFNCQHGPEECYGNKLHACAIDALQNVTAYVNFNVCMMKMSLENSSDDNAADDCGKSMNIDSGPIKECAKSDKGTQLHKHYGDESTKATVEYVPYILINGVIYRYHVKRNNNLIKAVCAAFSKPPPQCKEEILQ